MVFDKVKNLYLQKLYSIGGIYNATNDRSHYYDYITEVTRANQNLLLVTQPHLNSVNWS